jgi:uncharacterized protein YbcV (DUF1398 family)
MFTTNQILQRHAQVKSGADFPAYIRDIKEMGVISYQTFVADGHTDFLGADNYTTSLPAKYATLAVSDICDSEQFKANLREHQKGKTDYLTFIGISAKLGVEKWQVCMEKMTCTYYDRAGNGILVEEIPR